MNDIGPYPTFTSKRLPVPETKPNGTIVLHDDDGTPLLALTFAAAEDLADMLTRAADLGRYHVAASKAGVDRA
jgi:hypothetical protein